MGMATGPKVNTLSPWQLFLQTRKGKGKDVGYGPGELKALADEFFGPLPIPAGATIISQTDTDVTFRDAEGFETTLHRTLDGRDPSAGQVKTISTNKPNVQGAPQGQQGLTEDLLNQFRQLAGLQSGNAAALARGETPAGLDPGTKRYLDQIEALSQQLQGPTSLVNLTPENQALLDQISGAERARLQQQFDQAQGDQLARLFGNRLNQSSVATGALGQLLQQQGLVSQQQQADAAARQLATQQYLTNTQQGNRQLSLQGLLGAAQGQLGSYAAQNEVSQAQLNGLRDLLSQFTGQQTQRDLASAGISQADRDLAERARQANLGFELNQQDADLRAAQARQNSLLSGIVKGVAGGLINFGLGKLGPPSGSGGG